MAHAFGGISKARRRLQGPPRSEGIMAILHVNNIVPSHSLGYTPIVVYRNTEEEILII